VLFAVGKGDRAELRSKMLFTLGISIAIGVPAAVLVALLAPALLGLFGATYASSGTACLVLLAMAFPANVVKQHYVAVKRVDDQLRAAWQLMAWLCIAEIVTVAVVGARWGVTAGTAGLLVVMCIEGALTAPTVYRTLWPIR
jgi:O-antigen/teichoic acid export membrane protein